jgi:very-short-patch-repair endonuclease
MRRAQPWKTNRARVLRSNATSAEDRLWYELRARRLNGMKFVRQCPIGPFFVDFACREARIVVEVDGGTHSSDEEVARDRARSAYLESEGFRIFRAHNIDVYENMDGVLETLMAFVRAEVS